MASQNYNSPTLGPWSGADFEETASHHRGVGADSDLPDEYRFLRGVVHLLRKRMAQSDNSAVEEDGNVAIFVLKPGPPASSPNAPREPMIDSGRKIVVGKLWFVAASVASAHYVDLPQDVSDDVLFSFVTDQHCLGSQPALFFEGRTPSPQLRWYPNGLGNPDNVVVKPLVGNVSTDEVFAAINRLYQECLVTPVSLPLGGTLWTNSAAFLAPQ